MSYESCQEDRKNRLRVAKMLETFILEHNEILSDAFVDQAQDEIALLEDIYNDRELNELMEEMKEDK